MANIIDSLSRTDSTPTPRGVSSRPSACASGELAKLEGQLSDWVHCASSKTSAGKAKIEEISGKIETIKVQVRSAEDEKVKQDPQVVTNESSNSSARGLRFDGLGAWLNVQA